MKSILVVFLAAFSTTDQGRTETTPSALHAPHLFVTVKSSRLDEICGEVLKRMNPPGPADPNRIPFAVIPNKRTHQIFVMGTPEEVQRAKSMIEELDQTAEQKWSK